ncbi:MAG: MCE family protein, partial [Actinomycetota bacterium]|nr:MCE family protein [Actinomycetota bacterium]
LYPDHPSGRRISAGAVVRSRNVSTEVNTVFQNLVDLLRQIDPAKMNATMTAIADGVRGQGERIGQAISDANQVLQSLNPRMDTLHRDWRAMTGFADAYSNAAQDLAAVLDAASTTSATVTHHAPALDRLLLNTIGLSRAGTDLVGPNQGNLIQAINGLEPTTTLLRKYEPVYACLLLGAKWFLDNGGYERIGGNGRTSILDSAILLGDDPYRFPDNLPLVAAKGGPGGKPGCGSLPDASKNFPVRQLVTNTGWDRLRSGPYRMQLHHRDPSTGVSRERQPAERSLAPVNLHSGVHSGPFEPAGCVR